MKNLLFTNPKKILAGATAVLLLASSMLTSCAKSDPPRESLSSAAESTVSQPESTASAPEPQETEVREIRVHEPEYTVCAGVSTTTPDSNLDSIDSLDIRSTSQGQQSLLLWIPLPAGIRSDALVSVTLRLRRESGDEPQLQARGIAQAWDRLAVTWDNIQEHIVGPTSPPSQKADSDWHELDITNIMKTWLTGETGSNGLLVEQIGDNAQTTFFSPYRDDPADSPELVIIYRPEAELETFGKFEYEAQQEGNCLSFALRDQHGIFADDLGIDDALLEQEFRQGGIDQALAYVQKLSEDYVQANIQGLQLASFREIPAFDSEIDKDREYRAVLKIGIRDYPMGISFDYHWRMQLADGSWAEKFGPSASRIVPGSNGDLDPGLYPWDQNEYWGTSKWGEFYTSKAIYYAVEKNSAEFTNHK